MSGFAAPAAMPDDSPAAASKSPADDIRALLKLINTSAESALAQYESSASGVVPSIHSNEGVTPPENPGEMRKALRTLEGACYQLCTVLSEPTELMYTRTFLSADMACMRVVVNFKIADVLHEHNCAMGIGELAAKIDVDATKLLRVMRNLCTKHIFREVSSETFANTPLSDTLRTTHPMYPLMWLRQNVFNQLASSSLYDALKDPEYGRSMVTSRSAFSWAIKDEGGGTWWDWLQRNPESNDLFNKGLIAIASANNVDAVIKDFPWRDLPPNTSVCDVGSGVGAVTLGLAKSYPHLKLTLQDLPDVLDQAKQMWADQCPEALDRAAFVPIDFLNDAPVQGKDIYFVRQVIHDWADPECVTILTNVRKAMSFRSRLLIHEYVLPTHADDGNDVGWEKAPEPLLPGYGYGSAKKHLQDIDMMVLFNAGERTLSQIKALGTQAGLRFVKIWDFTDTCIVEFALLEEGAGVCAQATQDSIF